MSPPGAFTMVDFGNIMAIFRTESITVSGFDAAMGSSWFEFTNRTSGTRHQAWWETPQSVEAKSRFAFGSGMRGVAFWRGNEVFGRNAPADANGTDSADAQAMYGAAAAAAAAFAGGGYGGRGHFHPARE